LADLRRLEDRIQIDYKNRMMPFCASLVGTKNKHLAQKSIDLNSAKLNTLTCTMTGNWDIDDGFVGDKRRPASKMYNIAS